MQTEIKEKNSKITGPASGFKDYFGRTADIRKNIVDNATNVFSLFGYERLETSVIERNETLRGKGGEETEKLIYDVTDTSGESKLALRFDLTVPLARFMLQNSNELQLPFKRFAFGDVFRGETPQMGRGRLRGFMQCDADCVGVKSDILDAEIILMTYKVFVTLGIDSQIRINNRKILDALMEKCKVNNTKDRNYLIGLIDDFEKAGKEKTLELLSARYSENIENVMVEYLNIDSNSGVENVLNELKRQLGEMPSFDEGFTNLKNVCEILSTLNLPDDFLVIDHIIARGLDYYTGIIFETRMIGVPEIGSICSGGRYDKLIEKLGGPDLPAIGTSLGVDRIIVGLEKLGKLQDQANGIKAYVVVFDESTRAKSMEIVNMLRENAIRAVICLKSEKVSKQLAESSKLGAEFTIICGQDEIDKGGVMLKNMNSGEQEFVGLSELVETLR